jgi:hypothetical protein
VFSLRHFQFPFLGESVSIMSQRQQVYDALSFYGRVFKTENFHTVVSQALQASNHQHATAVVARDSWPRRWERFCTIAIVRNHFD